MALARLASTLQPVSTSRELGFRSLTRGHEYIDVGGLVGSDGQLFGIVLIAFSVYVDSIFTRFEILEYEYTVVVAIGGINGKNLMELSGSGVDGVAVVSGIFAAEDPGKATADLLKLAKEVVASNG